ncbi:MAG: hypothetical protein IJ192_01165 [Clostridia bacterium]|nr:hypothetical protein [Clostridia bacterium]
MYLVPLTDTAVLIEHQEEAVAVSLNSFTAEAPLLSFAFTLISNVPAEDGLKVAVVAEPNFVHVLAELLL